MPEKPLEPGQSPEDQLADYADQILEGASPQDSGPIRDEMKALQEIINDLHTTPPDPGQIQKAAQRVKPAVQDAYAKEFDSAQENPAPGLFQRLFGRQSGWQSSTKRSTFALRLAIAAVIVLLVLVPFLPVTPISLPGAAPGDGGLWPVLLLIASGGAILVWLLRRTD